MNYRDSYTNDLCPCCKSEDIYFYCTSNEYEMLKCNKCKFGFIKDIPSEQELEKYYASSYVENGSFNPHNSLTRKLRYWSLMKEIKRTMRGRSKVRLLEIGCSQGDLLSTVKDDGFFTSTGIDYAKGPTDYAKEIGLNVYQSSLHDMKFTDNQFNYVVAYHVIEHVQNLDYTFSEINRITEEGGYFHAVVPCFSHIKAIIKGEKWKYIGPPGHLWYFSINSFRCLLERHGFSVIFTSNFYRKAHMKIVAQKLNHPADEPKARAADGCR